MRWKGIAAAVGGIAVAAIGVAVLLRGNPPREGPSAGRRAAMDHAWVPATVNVAAYNAKMLKLANLPRCALPAATHSGAGRKARMRRISTKPRSAVLVTRKRAPAGCLPQLWPVHTLYPDAGSLLPFKRIVAYYGNFFSPRMGVLGDYPRGKVLAMLKAQAAAWAKADPTTPVIPAVDYIVVSAQGVPGRTGKYMMRMPPSQIEKAIGMADQIHGLVFLDVQPGWSTVRAEVPRLARYLRKPNVELALDPEFALTAGKRPGNWRGTMSAADINFAARFLAKIVMENHLRPKILVVHRFTQGMVTGYRGIRPLPQVEVVMDMDGFGSPPIGTSSPASRCSSPGSSFSTLMT